MGNGIKLVVKNGKIINDFIGYRKLSELIDRLNN